jgi:hypothetical protein
MTKKKKPKIIIEGITESGTKFRPSDWAERVSGNLSTFKNHRIFYSPLLRPSYKDGNRCVILDPELKETNPALYQHILDFAHSNKLKICGQETEIEDADKQENPHENTDQK